MNNSHSVLRNVTNFRNNGKSQPISGIELVVDEASMYFAGNYDGYVLTIDCPYGTQAMANDLLAKAKGFEYQGFTAEQVILPPETELGDGVAVAGVYGMIARRSFKFTPGMTSNVEAPRELEVQHEYKYESPLQRELKRTVRLGDTYYGTSISRRNGIQVKTIDASGNVLATATFNADGISFVTPDGSGISLGADGKFHGNLQMDGSISWADLDSNVRAEIDDRGDDNPSYIKTTYIDSAKIVSPNIYGGLFYATGQGKNNGAAYYIYDGADIDKYGNVTLGNRIGFISYDTSGTGYDAPRRVIFKTLNDEALKLEAAGNMSLQAKDYIYVHTPLHLASGVHYGTVLPSEGLSPGRLFFLLDE